MCSTLPALKRRISEETPEYDKWDIHGLVSQTAQGELTLGDSHEYGLAVSVFDKPWIDDLVMRYTRRFLKIPDWTLAERWHGVYAKHPEKPFVRMCPSPEVRVITATGGSGMTLSFGIAEQTIRALGWPLES